MVAAWLVARSRTVPPPLPGIPLTLAEDRAARVSGLRYEVAFRIPDRRSDPITGRLAASLALSDASRALAFDFAQPAGHVTHVAVNGRTVDGAAPINGHIVIAPRFLVRGANAIEFEFVAGDEPLNRGDDFMYTLFVPARASLAMPCFDQPDLKARWTLSLDLPAAWTAVANGAQNARVASRDRVRRGVRRDAAAAHLPLRVRRRAVPRRNRRARRPHVPHVPSRDRRREGRAQP